MKNKYFDGTKKHIEIDSDPSRSRCISCERLFFDRNLRSVSEYSDQITVQMLGADLGDCNYWK